MNLNSRNDEKNNDQYNHGLKKVTFWEKYGAKSFPYRGRRRYSPFVYRSEDGGIIISNDLFGLTIRQFEEIYKTCLNRRQKHEQYILNLRYPDKSSNEYFEYLLDSTDNNKDNVTWTINDLKERYLYEHLVNTAGSEIDIRKRQQLFIIQDMIQNEIMLQFRSKLRQISSGSLAEGLDLPGSDRDLMYVIQDVDVIQDIIYIKHPVQHTTLVMETDNDHPGFTYLRLIAGGEGDSQFIPPECFESTKKGLYLSVKTFVSNILKPSLQPLVAHGPCISDTNQLMDFAFCLRSKYLPYKSIQWTTRYRLQWPPNAVIDKISKYGCLLVPIGPRTLPDCNVLWRLSFSVAEKQLVHSFNFVQILCYYLLKLTLKHIVNINEYADGLLCSYFLKTALFWVSEEIDIDTFQISNLYSCYFLCLSKLVKWVNNCYCPNYFIPEQNMFRGKINTDNNTLLLKILKSLKCDGIERLIHCLFHHDNSLLGTERKPSFIMLDLLFFRISYLNIPWQNSTSQCLKLLELTEYLRKSKLSTLSDDVCKYKYAQISQLAAQLLPPPAAMTEGYNIHKRYHRHLQDGIKTDAVSGWLLYASFYYVTEQFNVTLRLTDYVLSRCTPKMVSTSCHNHPEGVINYYINHVHCTMTLYEKMKMAVVSDVYYVKHSSLIPKELQPEVKIWYIGIPPIVMCYCLKFLCYHHIGDISKRQFALLNLESIVKGGNLSTTYVSYSITILGVCFEISGDKDTAYQCYDEALQCESSICLSAEARRSKLLSC